MNAKTANTTAGRKHATPAERWNARQANGSASKATRTAEARRLARGAARKGADASWL